MTRPMGLLLAAGRSERLGRDKRRLLHRGETLLRRAARALAATAQPALVVLPAGAFELAGELAGLEVEVVANPEPERGMGRSLALGAAALLARGAERGTLLVTLVDQPAVDEALLAALVTAAAGSGGWAACDYGGGEWGTPVCLPAAALPELARLDGDERVSCPAARLDIDRAEDYARWTGESPS